MSCSNWTVYGQEQPPPAPLLMRAGPLTMLFDPQNAFVRRVCLGEREVLRGIYTAVRDRNWGTVRVRITNLTADVRADAFELNFDADCRAGDIHFRWQGQLSGSSDGMLRFLFQGEALTTFLKSRIGCCVLHPLLECCGAPARQERVDGKRIECRFPTLIEPQIVGQSTFRNLRSLAHQVVPGCWAELQFDGDVFETEDQRNWTDASFKTYCTPLALPFPVVIEAGARLRQAVTLRLTGPKDSTSAKAETSRISIGQPRQPEKNQLSRGAPLVFPREPAAAMPRLGVGLASHGIPLSPEEVSRLSLLRLSHLRVDLRMGDSGWPAELHRALTEAQQLGIGLEVALHVGRDGSGSALAECGTLLKRIPVPIVRVLAFRQSEPATSLSTLQLVRRSLDLPNVIVGGGSDAHFCELNREHALGRFGLAEADCVSWPITPQVHAFDDLSVMENLEAQPHAVATARAFTGKKPLAVSPVTLRPRFNAVASGEERQSPEQLPSQVDARQLSLFNAAWTLGSIASLANANVESLTYFETTGWRGLMETSPPATRHPLFPSVPGMVFPVYHVLAALAGFSRMAPMPREHSCQNTAAFLCLFDPNGKRRLLCANLTASRLPLSLVLGAERVTVRTLEPVGTAQSPLAWSSAEPRLCPSQTLALALSAYGIASVDIS